MADSRKSHKSGGEVRIGNYIIGETLGVGTFGKVKVGIHKSTGVQVAVKIVNRDKIKQLDVAGKLRREIENLWLFRHPHIIKLYQVISTPTDIFMIMEYVCGGELFDHIVKAGKLCEKDARRFFQQIVSGVDYCHRHKVVHRDLKPENLLLDSNSNVKIADFGLSNIMEDGEFLNTSCGSPNYAAPEVISGKLYAGPEVDVWSCGVILYALLCGTLPFDDEQIPNLFKKIKSGLFRMPDYLSEGVRDLLRAMLTVDPIKRITIEEIKRHTWFVVELPGYLFPQDRDEDASIIDKEAVLELSRVCNVSENEILTALIGNDPTDQLCVAYHLIIDNKRYGSEVNMEEVNNFYVATGPDTPGLATPQMSTGGNGGGGGSTPTSGGGAVVGNSVPLSPMPPGAKVAGSPHCVRAPRLSGDNTSPNATPHLCSAMRAHPERMPEAPPMSRTLDPLPDSGQVTGPAASQVKRFKWHLGIRSQSKPWDIMHEVFKAMRSLGYEWKVVNPFNVRVRKWNPLKQHYSKLVLQLYQVDTRSYLLDFKCIDENPHPESDPMNSRRRSSGLLGSLSSPVQERAPIGLVQCTSGAGVVGPDLPIYSPAQRHQTMEFFEMCTELITTLAR